MKYVVVLADGAADTPVAELNGKTPLEAANKPNIDELARHGEVGMVKTVPEGLPPGSDVANLAVFGYDPQKYYTGRSPLEAVSMKVPLELTDTTSERISSLCQTSPIMKIKPWLTTAPMRFPPRKRESLLSTSTRSWVPMNTNFSADSATGTLWYGTTRRTNFP